MRNHNEKLRDMSRSVLPSTARKGARDNAALIKRKNRAKVRRTLHVWKQYDDPDEFTGFADYDYIYGYGEDQNIKMMVRERRGADKLSVVHWAERLCATKLADLDEEERYAWFKRALPDNTIGRHALGHIADAIAPVFMVIREGGYGLRYLIEDGEGWFRPMTPTERHASFEADEKAKHKIDVDKLTEILATPGAHTRFNDALKRQHYANHALCRTAPCYRCTRDGFVEPRLFLGGHDIDAWLASSGGRYALYSAHRILTNFVVQLY